MSRRAASGLDLSGGSPAAAAQAGGETAPAAPLGDYRLLREVGRGGMGIVYDAVQLSLGRRVALKVLPFAAALDPRQLQRFHNEAHAAAHLHHTNIVPVYAVGERGVHLYAMQLIDGQSVAALIRELRQGAGLEAPPLSAPPPPAAPAPSTSVAAALTTEGSTRSPAFCRTAARLGLQTAEALEHAHAEGVIHRDVKPANLLVNSLRRFLEDQPIQARRHRRQRLVHRGPSRCGI
jgi:serine/threonine protein kinase